MDQSWGQLSKWATNFIVGVEQTGGVLSRGLGASGRGKAQYQSGSCSTPDGGLGGSWSLRHFSEGPEPPWRSAQCCLPSGITRMLIIMTIATTIVLRMFVCQALC